MDRRRKFKVLLLGVLIALTVLGLMLVPTGGEAAQATKWSSKAHLYIRLQNYKPPQGVLGYGATVTVYYANGSRRGRKIGSQVFHLPGSSLWWKVKGVYAPKTNLRYFGVVNVDKGFFIHVRWRNGQTRWFRIPARRPYTSKRTICLYYNGSYALGELR